MSLRADSVPSIFEDALHHLGAESPAAHVAICVSLRGKTVAYFTDGQSFSTYSNGHELTIGAMQAASTICIDGSSAAILSIIEGSCTILEALADGSIAIRAGIDDAVALHEALRAFVHGCALAPSCAPLRSRFEAIVGGARAGTARHHSQRDEREYSG